MRVKKRNIFIAENDRRKLQGIIAGVYRYIFTEDQIGMLRFKRELDDATVIPREFVPDDIITLNSRFRVRSPRLGEVKTCSLVFPVDADWKRGRISVLSALGMALLGRSAGQKVSYDSSNGKQEIEIIEVLRRPLPRPAAEGVQEDEMAGAQTAGRPL